MAEIFEAKEDEIMSPAVMMTPAAVSIAIQLTPFLVPIFAAVVVGEVIHALAEGSKQQNQAAAAIAQRSASLKFVREELGKALKSLQERAAGSLVSGKGRKALDQEFLKLENLREVFLKRVENGRATHEDINGFRDDMDAFNFRLIQEEARFKEQNHRFAFLQERFRLIISQSSLEDQQQAGIVEQEIMEMPETRIEDQLAAMEKAIIGLEKGLEKSVFRKMLSSLVDVPAGKSDPVGPAPGTPPDQPRKKKEEKSMRLLKARQDIHYFLKRLEEDFPEVVTDTMKKLETEAVASHFTGRVQAIRDEVKMLFHKQSEMVVHSEFFREKLKAGMTLLDPASDLGMQVSTAIAGRVIDREVFTHLFTRIEEELAHLAAIEKRRQIEQKVREELARLDYVVMGVSKERALAENLMQGRITLIDTKYDDYKLLVKLAPDDSLSARLVRVVADEREKENVSEIQIQRDRDLLSEWCGNLDAFLESMRQSGIVLVEKVRIEQKVDYFTIEQLEQARVEVTSLKTRKAEGAKHNKKRSL